MITNLQQQVNIMLQQQGGSRVEIAKPPTFAGKMENISTFINMS